MLFLQTGTMNVNVHHYNGGHTVVEPDIIFCIVSRLEKLVGTRYILDFITDICALLIIRTKQNNNIRGFDLEIGQSDPVLFQL